MSSSREHGSVVDKPSKASNRHDAHRPLALWHVAVNATKGLFGQPSRAAPDDDATTAAASTSTAVPPAADARKLRVRKSISSPSLKEKANRSRHDLNDADFSPSPSSFFNSHSLNPSPRKTRTAHPVGRPIISPPSLPQHLDSFDFPHPRLPYPLSPMPSPSGSTFSFKAPFIQSSSNLSSGLSVSENDAAGPGGGPSNSRDSRLVRRRTKSAPGIKFGKRPFFSPGLPTAVEIDNNEPYSPVIIDIASPSTASFSSRSVETPKMSSECFSQFPSPVIHSPRSFTSVKRKPVPRHLYTDPPDHDPSTPCTPLLAPVPETPPASLTHATRHAGPNPLHTPLLPSSELILRSCGSSRTNRRDLTLLPIGQPKASSSSSTRGQRRRSVSERGLGCSLGGYGLPSPWFAADSNGSITPLLTPSEESAPFSLSDGLPPPPRGFSQSPPQTPLRLSEELSTNSDDVSSYSALSRGSGLSPLTDEEIVAIRTFLHRHTTGHRARQRRKGCRGLSLHSIRNGGSPVPSGLYDRILESYLDDDEFFSASGSEDDEDTESHAPPSTLETNSTSALSLLRPYEQEQDDEADSAVGANTGQDEVETPVDQVNRGTFGYYDVPMVRSSRNRKDSGGVYAYAYIPSDSEVDVHSVHPEEWRDTGGDYGNMAQVMKSLRSEAMNAFGAQNVDFECPDNISNVRDLERSSSVYYRPPSDCMHHEDEFFSGLRISRQPLVPRTLNSDSESERPISSSTSASFSISTSTGGSAFAPGIGLKIIPHEQFAYFDAYDRDRSGSFVGCQDENDSEGSPTTLACTSSPQRSQERPDDIEHRIEHLSSSFDRLQTSFAKIRAQTPDAESLDMQRTAGVSSLMLKPALHIKSGSNITSAVVGLPSPADTVATYPPFTRAFSQGCTRQKPAPLGSDNGKDTSASADEASTASGGNVRSFMNLTPNDPEPKPRSRVRLRQLFSRANLRTPTGRKTAADSKSRTS